MRRTTAALVTIGLAVLTACSSTTPGHPVSAGTTRTPSVVPAGSVPASGPPASTPAAPAGAALTNPDDVSSMLAEVNAAVVGINSYDYRYVTRPGYRDQVLSYATGPFRKQLALALTTIIENAPRQHSYQTAVTLHSGVADLRGGAATVMIFGQLTLNSRSLPKERTDPFTAVVGVTLVHGHWLLNRLEVNGPASCDPPGNAELVTACHAAVEGVAAITTFHRASFDRDFARAAARLTDPLLSDFRAKKASTLRAMRNGGFDLRGDVVAAAVEVVNPTEVLVLVSVNGYRSGESTPMPQHLRATVKNVGGRWLLADVQTA